MGRKSRRCEKGLPAGSEGVRAGAIVEVGEALLPCAIYARLSVENSGKDDEGASIENQIEICSEYIDGEEGLLFYKTYEDNGWTGTVMERPAFEEMMSDIRAGLVKAVVVKDLSRLGRNYLETGTYLESVFPKLGVRFIALKEGYDSFEAGRSESVMVPLQNMLNDFYAKDISRKIHAAFKVRREEKSFKCSLLPYGYGWNDDHTELILDKDQGAVVKGIFRDYLNGENLSAIARKLNESGVASPGKVRYGGDARWGATSIANVIRNPVYYGAAAWGRHRSELYANVKKHCVSREDWVIRENDHEAVVSRDEYEAAVRMYEERSRKREKAIRRNRSKRASVVDLFKGKMFCGHCGGRLYFVSDICRSGNVYGRYVCKRNEVSSNGCLVHSWSKEDVDGMVLDTIRTQVDLACEYEKLIVSACRSEYKVRRERELSGRVNVAFNRVEVMQGRRKRLYEDYVEGILSADEYSETREVYESKLAQFEVEYEQAVAELDRFRENISSKNRWVRMLKGVGRSDRLTQEMVDSLIERVMLFSDKKINVVFRFEDIFVYTRDFLRKAG